MNTIKYCEDCLHHRAGECFAPQNDMKDKSGKRYVRRGVASIERRRFEPCWAHREDGWLDSWLMNTCGRRARWFEAKESEQVTT